MKKVLFITTRLIYPVNDGRKVVLYNYCKGLADQHNCEVRLFSLVDEEETKKEQPNFISEIYYSKLPNKIEKMKNLILKSILLNKWPLQVSLYYSNNAQKELDRVINEYNPDIVICDMARTAQYLKRLDGYKYNKILDMDDVLSKRYQRQANSGVLGKSAVGAYSNKLPKIFNCFLNNRLIMKFILTKEAKLLEKYEIKIAKYYKSIVFVSPLEANEFNTKIGENKSIDITIGVDYDYFSEFVVKEKKDNYIVFLGNMYVAHNKDSVRLFIKNVFPEILRSNPKCVFRIVGKCSEEFKRELSNYENIEITGEVEDIRKYIQDCTVAIAPLVYGSGIKTKILETMAMGVPIVTNSIGVEGINVVNNKEIFVCDTDEDFKDKVNELLRDRNLREEVRLAAQKVILNEYKWENILEKFRKIL